MTQYDLYLNLKAWILKYCFLKLYKLNENTEYVFYTHNVENARYLTLLEAKGFVKNYCRLEVSDKPSSM